VKLKQKYTKSESHVIPSSPISLFSLLAMLIEPMDSVSQIGKKIHVGCSLSSPIIIRLFFYPSFSKVPIEIFTIWTSILSIYGLLR